MKKIVILSCFIAFAFVVLFPRSFIFAAEETEHYETVIDKVADAYIGKAFQVHVSLYLNTEKLCFQKPTDTLI